MSENKQKFIAILLGVSLLIGYGLLMESCKKTEVIEEPPPPPVRVDKTACVKCHEPFVYEYVKAKYCIDCHHGVDQLTNIDTCHYAGFKRIN